MRKLNESKIAIIGLGYVGLPLAVEFSKKFDVIGFDINNKRISELLSLEDVTNEVEINDLRSVISLKKLKETIGLKLTSSLNDLTSCNTYIITVPTPVNRFKAPNLDPLLKASKQIGKILSRGDVVIYESTVYPGCTEEDCIPILEKNSDLSCNIDFFCGYSPERINPGDKLNTLKKIVKVTSGSTPKTAKYIDELYKAIITAGTHMAASIKIAEASKAIENAQRDVNISFVNELALIFDRMGIDTNDVLDAASTKWNFLNFKPGLVGGHCIGVDPYYLVHKAKSLGYTPQVILSGRRVNDNMGMFIANKLTKLMIQRGMKLKGSKVLLLGITFKENCPDIRNTKVIDIYKELIEFGLHVDVFDPLADSDQTENELGITLCDVYSKYESIVLAVAHNQFKSLDFEALKSKKKSIVFDIKGILEKSIVDIRL